MDKHLNKTLSMSRNVLNACCVQHPSQIIQSIASSAAEHIPDFFIYYFLSHFLSIFLLLFSISLLSVPLITELWAVGSPALCGWFWSTSDEWQLELDWYVQRLTEINEMPQRISLRSLLGGRDEVTVWSRTHPQW